jgi:hypothetical protein
MGNSNSNIISNNIYYTELTLNDFKVSYNFESSNKRDIDLDTFFDKKNSILIVKYDNDMPMNEINTCASKYTDIKWYVLNLKKNGITDYYKLGGKVSALITGDYIFKFVNGEFMGWNLMKEYYKGYYEITPNSRVYPSQDTYGYVLMVDNKIKGVYSEQSLLDEASKNFTVYQQYRLILNQTY